jgi:hypothetical protein
MPLKRMKFEQVSHIYASVACSRQDSNRIDFAIGGKGGLFFGSLQNNHIGVTS